MTDQIQAEEPEFKIQLTNYPPSSSEAVMQMVSFGPIGPIRMMLTIEESDEDENTMIAGLTISNAAEHAEVPEFLADMIQLLQMIQETSGAALEEQLGKTASES